MKKNVDSINTFASNDKDELEQFLNKFVILNPSWVNRPLFGVIVALEPSYVSLTRKDGRIIKIQRSSILAVEEAPKKAV